MKMIMMAAAAEVFIGFGGLALARPEQSPSTVTVDHDAAALRPDHELVLLAAPFTHLSREGDDVGESFGRLATGVNYEALGVPPGLTLDRANGTISGHFGNDAAGQYVVTLRATNADHVETVTFTWVVLDVTLPQITSPGVLINKGGDEVAIMLQGRDADGDLLTYAAYGLPPGLTVDAATGRIQGQLAPHDLRTTYTVTVSASDGHTRGGEVFTWMVLPSSP